MGESRVWMSVVRAIVRAQRKDDGVTLSSVLRRGVPRGREMLRYEQRGRALADALVKEGWTPPPEGPR